MKKFQGGAGAALFQQFRDTLSQHEEQQQQTRLFSSIEPDIVHTLHEITKDSKYSLSKLSKVSMAAASLVYLYQGLLEYAGAWYESTPHRRVVEYARIKIQDIDIEINVNSHTIT